MVRKIDQFALENWFSGEKKEMRWITIDAKSQKFLLILKEFSGEKVF